MNVVNKILYWTWELIYCFSVVAAVMLGLYGIEQGSWSILGRAAEFIILACVARLANEQENYLI